MKIISMYLPQFHRVKENDEWWGEGFTEWTAVKSAVKLYEDHYQPHIPLNNNYYNLLDKNTMKWQANLMKQYGVDGQCFYHYWFKDGRRILEKPAENLLCWKDIEMPFCFCWANETWARTWSKISSKNAWAGTFEKKKRTDDAGVLLEQKYGDEVQWKKHFDYLLSFFRDPRYITVDGCPLFLIYKSNLIYCLAEMLFKFNEWAQKEGFKGIYVIGINSNANVEKELDAVLYHQPVYTNQRTKYKKTNSISNMRRLEYDYLWEDMLLSRPSKKKTIFGGFVGYDNTSRMGKDGVVVENATPEKFKRYLSELIAKNIVHGNDLIFINAWNEWGEGMHLEPDERYQYGFLEAIPYAKEHYIDFLSKYQSDFLIDSNTYENEITMWTNKCVRYESYWKILNAWLCLKENDVSLEKYFVKKNIRSITIYGMGMLGKHLLDELKDGKVEVKCAVDQRADRINAYVKMYSPEDSFPETDAIVVTATYAFQEIKEQLKARGYKNVISLEEIILEVN